jgi:hypothetical protein
MGSNKILYVIIILLLAAIIGGGVYFILNKTAGPETESTSQPPAASQTPAAVVSTNGTLSEQPNQAKFNEYLTKANLGKFPADEEFSPFKVVATTVFTSADQFCTSLDIKKTIISGSLSVAVYDTVKKDYLQSKAVFPVEFKKGGSIGCGSLEQPVGKYEYKIYIDDVLTVVLPFEVK